MTSRAPKMTPAGLAPLLQYRDVSAAIGWLTNTFGFETRTVVREPDGTIAYAELTYGNGLIMLGPAGQSILDPFLKQPEQVGGAGTQCCYLAVPDLAAHYAQTCAAGADIVLALDSAETGSRAYAARDPEGHIWNFGDYSPWRPTLVRKTEPQPVNGNGPVTRPSRLHMALAASVAALALGSTVAMLRLESGTAPADDMAAMSRRSSPIETASITPRTDAIERDLEALRLAFERESEARHAADTKLAEVLNELIREKSAREAVEAHVVEQRENLALERARADRAEEALRLATAALAAAPAAETAPSEATATQPPPPAAAPEPVAAQDSAPAAPDAAAVIPTASSSDGAVSPSGPETKPDAAPVADTDAPVVPTPSAATAERETADQLPEPQSPEPEPTAASVSAPDAPATATTASDPEPVAAAATQFSAPAETGALPPAASAAPTAEKTTATFTATQKAQPRTRTVRRTKPVAAPKPKAARNSATTGKSSSNPLFLYD